MTERNWEQKPRFIPWLAAASVLICPTAGSELIHVPQDYPTIQRGIDAAYDGDEVVVSRGIYGENIDFLGKAITVRSQDPSSPEIAAATIIDGGEKGSVVTFRSGEGPDSVLAGLTIRNGSGTYFDYLGRVGGGIYCDTSSPTLENNIVFENDLVEPEWGWWGINHGGGIFCYLSASCIANNTISRNAASNYGGGIYFLSSDLTLVGNTITENQTLCLNEDDLGGGISAWYSTARLEGNIISDNRVDDDGGGIQCFQCPSLTLVDNVIANNEAHWGGGIICGDSVLNLTNNLIVNNKSVGEYSLGGGILCYYATKLRITNTTIAHNEALDYGGGIYCDGTPPYVYPTIIDSIIWGNEAPEGPQIYCGGPSFPSISYTDIQGGWVGTGNIDDDPLFVAGPQGEYYLDQEESPCVDAGRPVMSYRIKGTTSTDNRRDTGIVDMGYHYPISVSPEHAGYPEGAMRQEKEEGFEVGLMKPGAYPPLK